MKSELDQFLEFFSKIDRFGQLLQFKREVPAPGKSIYRMTVKEDYQSSPGVAHGGCLSALMDECMGLAALSFAVTQKQICSTVEFKINYLTPAKVGEVLVGKASVDYIGKHLVVVSGSIEDEQSGRAVAKALGTYNLYPAEKKDFLKEFM